ncbi:hypothetical protein M9H77_15393 [Catharanthus roseus]|uniref:Uncharacterized protein n=1 Tax=Catharanthus roseus TaxID=4058 RepID=A0ACC0AZ23_CATRO|nr:hypothetical protein M9H77_15393 [Catharanthus roseus]
MVFLVAIMHFSCTLANCYNTYIGFLLALLVKARIKIMTFVLSHFGRLFTSISLTRGNNYDCHLEGTKFTANLPNPKHSTCSTMVLQMRGSYCTSCHFDAAETQRISPLLLRVVIVCSIPYLPLSISTNRVCRPRDLEKGHDFDKMAKLRN